MPWCDRRLLAGSALRSWPPGQWELGLIGDNPLRYSLSLLQMIIGVGAFLFGVRQMKRFR